VVLAWAGRQHLLSDLILGIDAENGFDFVNEDLMMYRERTQQRKRSYPICAERLLFSLPIWHDVLKRYEHMQITPECRAQPLITSTAKTDHLLWSLRARGLFSIFTKWAERSLLVSVAYICANRLFSV